jgi:molybdopterin-guanine dinucleotide biosynthesis protein A
MGGPKALASMGGQSFLVRGVRALWSACDTVVVVTGAESARVMREAGDEFEALVDKGLLAPDLKGGPKGRKGELEVRFVENRAWKRGMLSSAQAGLAAALRFRPEGVLVLPVDHPRVTARTVQALANMLEQALGSFGGRRDGGFAYALAPGIAVVVVTRWRCRRRSRLPSRATTRPVTCPMPSVAARDWSATSTSPTRASSPTSIHRAPG